MSRYEIFQSIHIETSAPEGLTAYLRIGPQDDTVQVMCEDSTGRWSKFFHSTWECGQWVRSFGGKVSAKEMWAA